MSGEIYHIFITQVFDRAVFISIRHLKKPVNTGFYRMTRQVFVGFLVAVGRGFESRQVQTRNPRKFNVCGDFYFTGFIEKHGNLRSHEVVSVVKKVVRLLTLN